MRLWWRRQWNPQIFWWGPGPIGHLNLLLINSRRRERKARRNAYSQILMFCANGYLVLWEVYAGGYFLAGFFGSVAVMTACFALGFARQVADEQRCQVGLKKRVDDLWRELRSNRIRQNGWRGGENISADRTPLH